MKPQEKLGRLVRRDGPKPEVVVNPSIVESRPVVPPSVLLAASVGSVTAVAGLVIVLAILAVAAVLAVVMTAFVAIVGMAFVALRG